jgi:hypothetical protein
MKQRNPNTLVLDPKKGFGLEYIQEPKGRLWNYGKRRVYLMKRSYGTNGDHAETLEAYELPQKMGETPEKLFRALFWDKEAEILFTLRNLLLEKLKVIGIYVLIAIELLFLFLIFSSLLG